jgi:hypothetical protein
MKKIYWEMQDAEPTYKIKKYWEKTYCDMIEYLNEGCCPLDCNSSINTCLWQCIQMNYCGINTPQQRNTLPCGLSQGY